MRSSAPDPHDLVGAYVMDAVDQADRAAFEQHLTGCDSCADEVRELRETVARMAATEDVRPRPELRDQTMQAAARLRQVPPVVAEQAPRSRPRLLTFMRETGRALRGQSWTVRVAALAAVGCLAVAVVFGAQMHGAQSRLNAARAQAHDVALVLGAPDAVMSHRAGELVLTANGLPVLPRAWVYQVWLMGPAGDRSAGLLHAAHGKMAGPMLVTGLLSGDRVGLTVEPAGGSRRPTNRPILLLELGS
jgi:anti-sigma-K factor RskA